LLDVAMPSPPANYIVLMVVVVWYVYLVSFLVKEFSVLNFDTKCPSGVIFVMINRYLGREGIQYVVAFYAPNSFL